MTPLHFAVVNNQYEICSMLLASGINKDAKTKVDRTSLHLACYHGHMQIVELLLLYNCAVNPRDMVGRILTNINFMFFFLSNIHI